MVPSRRRPAPDLHQRRSRHRLTSLAVALGLAVAVPASPATAAPAAASPSALADKSSPGVQLIEVDFTATLSVPEPVVIDGATQALGKRLAAQAMSGAIDTSDAALTQAAVDEIAKNPFSYFKPGSKKATEDAQLSGFGTGWVVTPDGYMVTAAHVVQPDPAEIRTAFSQQALATFSKGAIEELQSGGEKFTAEQAKTLGDAMTKWAAKYLTVGNLKSTVSAQLGVAVAGFKKSQKGHPVQIVSVGESYPGKDVAILKLDGEAHLPTLSVGADTDVSTGATLYVAGYPAASTFYSGLSKDSQVQPSITQGPLTAIKSNEQGTPIFQTQAPASPGNSGGPVLDDSGKAVGILVASALNDQGVALEGQEFVIPISVVNEKLNEKNIKPSTSDTSTNYAKALDEYYLHHYKNAVPLFQKAAALYPGHPYAGDFISKSTAAIEAGKDETPSPILLWVGIGAGALVVAVAIVITVIMMRRRRRGGATPGGPSDGSPQDWAAAQPSQPYQQPQQPYQPGYQPPAGYPAPQQGYPPQQQPGYPPQQPGYPPPQQGYPPQQPGYPPPQPGYPPR